MCKYKYSLSYLLYYFCVKIPQLKQLIEENVYWELTVSGV